MLPAGGRRLIQRSTGYDHTFVAGVEVSAGGELNAACPGRLVRVSLSPSSPSRRGPRA